jgi:alpha-L-arabinofuranosidase
MKIIWIIVSCAFLFLISCKENPKSEGEIIIDAAQKGAAVSPDMYGVFFEEINHAGEGGLYGELLQNRGFEEKEYPAGYTVKGNKLYPPPLKNHLSGSLSTEGYRWNEDPIPGWSLQTQGSSKATMKLTKATPLDPGSPNSLEITIPQSAQQVELINSGFWGISLKQGERCNLRFFLRTPGYKGKLKACLISSAGSSLAVIPLVLKEGKGWQEYKLTIGPDQTDTNVKFALCFKGSGTVWVDYVSLFHEHTFKDRPNGMRPDVAEMLVGLHPGFIRWPGGCVVEGITLGNRFEWKKTLGDPMARSGQYSTWGYRSTYGYGYFEHLQFCEDIGAKAMFVCNVGLGCQARVGDACKTGDVQYYIDDVLDAIEYALGDPSTEWGAKRAAAGHPAPFPLQFIEIGNENNGPVYNERFDLFYKAIKSKYPQLTLISNHGLGNEVKKIAKTDMIDPHWYVAPDYFFKNASIFDKQPRGDHKIYVGEYACNQGVGGGNMLAALSEAAFITGMERNSDLVTMASYAPLFENKNDRTWPVNLIWVDNAQVVGRSSYYVQQMVAQNKPTYNLQTSVTPRQNLPLPLDANGYVGVGTWSTQSEYKDFKITTTENNTDLPLTADWIKQSGDWTVSDSLMSQHSSGNLTQLINTKHRYSGTYTYELKARKRSGNEGFLIYFGMSDQYKDGYVFNIGGWANTLTGLEKIEQGTAGLVSEQVPFSVDVNKWYSIKIVRTLQDISLFIDGVEILKYKAVTPLHQFSVAGYDEKSGEMILKVVNADEQPWRSTVKIKNSGKILAEGEVIALAAGFLKDENSYQQPLKISPKSTKYANFSESFDYEFAPASFTILRIKVNK